MHKLVFVFLFLCLASIPGRLIAQTYDTIPRFEAGLQLDLSSLGAVGFVGGAGGRFHYNFTPHYALDTEITYHQQDASPDNNVVVPPVTLGQTTALAGLRAGFREENVGAFFRARAGALHFASDHGAQLLSRSKVPLVDAGITIERYHGPMILRADIGEWIMFAGNATVSTGYPPVPARVGTRVSFFVGLGLAVRF